MAFLGELGEFPLPPNGCPLQSSAGGTPKFGEWKSPKFTRPISPGENGNFPGPVGPKNAGFPKFPSQVEFPNSWENGQQSRSRAPGMEEFEPPLPSGQTNGTAALGKTGPIGGPNLGKNPQQVGNGPYNYRTSWFRKALSNWGTLARQSPGPGPKTGSDSVGRDGPWTGCLSISSPFQRHPDQPWELLKWPDAAGGDGPPDRQLCLQFRPAKSLTENC